MTETTPLDDCGAVRKRCRIVALLQYLALHFRRVVWFNFHTYIRTASPQKPPSEWVVSHALRHTWPEFLAGSTEGNDLKKFLASKINLARCGYADLIGPEKAA